MAQPPSSINKTFSATNLFFADSTVFNVFYAPIYSRRSKRLCTAIDRIVITKSLKEKIFGSKNTDENVIDQPLGNSGTDIYRRGGYRGCSLQLSSSPDSLHQDGMGTGKMTCGMILTLTLTR